MLNPETGLWRYIPEETERHGRLERFDEINKKIILFSSVFDSFIGEVVCSFMFH